MKDQDRISKEKAPVKEDEIYLIALAKTLWEGRRTVIKTVIIFKKKRRKGYRLRKVHRQMYTALKIQEISA